MIIPTRIRWLKTSRKCPQDTRIAPLKIKIMLESKSLKSRILSQNPALKLSQITFNYRKKLA